VIYSLTKLLSVAFAITVAVLLFFYRGLETSDFLTYIPEFQNFSMSPYTWQEPIFWIIGKFFFFLCPICDPRINLVPLDVILFYLLSSTLFALANRNTIHQSVWLSTLLLSLPILFSYQVLTGALNIYKQAFGTAFFIMALSAFSSDKFKPSILFAILASFCHNIFGVFSLLLYFSQRSRLRLFPGYSPSIIVSLVCFMIFNYLGTSDNFDIALAGVQSGGDSRNILTAMLLLNSSISFIYVKSINRLFPFLLSLSLLNTFLAFSMSFFQESVIERFFLLSIFIQCAVSYIAYTKVCRRRIGTFLVLFLLELVILVAPVFVSPVIPVLTGWKNL
jgi:hypothetical protein